MDIEYISKNIQCSTEDKMDCMTTVNNILFLSEITRKEGLMEIENEIAKYDSEFLKLGISLIVDGTDPVIVEKILTNYLIAGKYQGKEFLKNILIISGILLIQRAINTIQIREILCSYFGIEFRKKFFDNLDPNINNSKSFREKFDLKYKNKKNLSENTNLLDKCLNLDYRTLQRILRELDDHTIAIALSGASGKVIRLFLNNLSTNEANYIAEEIEIIKPNEKSIIDAQNQVLDTMKELEKDGIIICSNI